MRHLRRNEDARQRGYETMQAQPMQLVRALHDGLSIIDDLGRVEALITALKQRLDDIATKRALARSVSEGVRRIAPDANAFDERSGLLSQASRSMYQIVDEEHEALATRILDGPMQRLASAGFEAEVAGRVLDTDRDAAVAHTARCRYETVAASAELTALAMRLQPISQDRPLSEALRAMLAEATGDQARLRVIGIQRRLAQLNEIALYRIVEEAVDNAARHGHSEHIEVTLSFHRDRVVLLVKDDGEGFDVVATEARLGRTRGLGLIKMQEQAALVGSRLEVRSLIGVGTEVRATLPQSV
jgi:two-component system, NarL family, sensor histidine kinase DegS